MSGRDALNERPSDAALAAALRALPEAAPVPDLWPDLARSIDARRRRPWRYALPVALAAGIALALVLPKFATHEVTPSEPATPVANASSPADDVELSQLHKRSQSLERWIAAVAARAPQDGRDLMAAVEVEDLIGLVFVGGVVEQPVEGAEPRGIDALADEQQVAASGAQPAHRFLPASL